MAVTLPPGWTNFQGGGSDPSLCEGPPPSMSVEGELACLPGQTEITLEATGGTPPFTWEVSHGSISVTGVRTAELSILAPANLNVISFFKVFAYYLATHCPDLQVCAGHAPNTVLSEPVFDVRLRAYNCAGGYVQTATAGTFPLVDASGNPTGETTNDNLFPDSSNPTFGHPIGDNVADRQCDIVDIGGVPTGGLEVPSDPTHWTVNQVRCTGGAPGTATVDFSVTTAGKNCVNGSVWSGAANYSGSITVNFENTCDLVVKATPEAPGQIDVRTQAMVDAECCEPAGPVDITITATDALGEQAQTIVSVPG